MHAWLCSTYQWNQRLHPSQHIMFTMVEINVQVLHSQSLLILLTIDIKSYITLPKLPIPYPDPPNAAMHQRCKLA